MKTRLTIGILFIALSIGFNQFFEHDLADFFKGILFGIGIGLLVTSLIKMKPRLH